MRFSNLYTSFHCFSVSNKHIQISFLNLILDFTDLSRCPAECPLLISLYFPLQFKSSIKFQQTGSGGPKEKKKKGEREKEKKKTKHQTNPEIKSRGQIETSYLLVSCVLFALTLRMPDPWVILKPLLYTPETQATLPSVRCSLATSIFNTGSCGS